MDKNKTLELARKDQLKGQEYENDAIKKNGNWSLYGGVVAATFLLLIEYFKRGTVNCSLIAVLSLMACIKLFLDGIKMKKGLFIIVGVLELFLAVFFFVYFLFQVV